VKVVFQPTDVRTFNSGMASDGSQNAKLFPATSWCHCRSTTTPFLVPRDRREQDSPVPPGKPMPDEPPMTLNVYQTVRSSTMKRTHTPIKTAIPFNSCDPRASQGREFREPRRRSRCGRQPTSFTVITIFSDDSVEWTRHGRVEPLLKRCPSRQTRKKVMFLQNSHLCHFPQFP